MDTTEDYSLSFEDEIATGVSLEDELATAAESAGLDRRRFVTGAISAGAALIVAPAAFGAGGSDLAARAKRGGRIRSGHVGGGTNESLRPDSSYSYIDAARHLQNYDGLLSFAPNNAVKLRLATSFEPGRDARHWNIKLRRGVTFHNGKPFSAADVLYTWKYTLDPKNGFVTSPQISMLDLKQTKAVNSHEISVVLNRPFAYWPLWLCSPWPMAIFPEGTTDFSRPIGTGPFKFVSWKRGQRSLFAKNNDYWVTGKPYVDEIEMISIPDSAARLNALLTRQIDMMEFPSFSQVVAQRSNRQLRVIHAKNAVGWTGFTMRLDKEPFRDNNVRLAFRHALDRRQALNVAYLGYGSLGNDLFGKGYASYASDVPQMTHDPEKARALLKKAGKEDVTVTLFTSEQSPGMLEMATAYVQQAKEAGINVKLRKIPADSYFDSGKFWLKEPFYQTHWNSGAFEGIVPYTMMPNVCCNDTGWTNAGWQARFNKASGIVNTGRRNASFKQLQAELWRQTGYMIPGTNDNLDLASARVKGIIPSLNSQLGGYDFKSYWID